MYSCVFVYVLMSICVYVFFVYVILCDWVFMSVYSCVHKCVLCVQKRTRRVGMFNGFYHAYP